jgi:hypothetical protein
MGGESRETMAYGTPDGGGEAPKRGRALVNGRTVLVGVALGRTVRARRQHLEEEQYGGCGTSSTAEALLAETA